MARAKVELKGAASHSVRGQLFLKGQPRILTDARQIAYYRGQSAFVVTDLPEEKKEAAPAAAPPKKAASRTTASSRPAATDAPAPSKEKSKAKQDDDEAPL